MNNFTALFLRRCSVTGREYLKSEFVGNGGSLKPKERDARDARLVKYFKFWNSARKVLMDNESALTLQNQTPIEKCLLNSAADE